MNTILLQMLPLLVFVVVDMLFTNTIISIISAVAFAIFQMVFTFLKTGTPDYLILIDVALIAGLGAVSIFLKNDLFFKLKPAIIEIIMVILIIALSLAPDQFIITYLSRFMPNNATFVPETLPMLKNMLRLTALYTLLHVGAVWYTAYYSSRKVWALVSGPGYFLFFIPIMGVLFFKQLRKRKRTTAIASE